MDIQFQLLIITKSFNRIDKIQYKILTSSLDNNAKLQFDKVSIFVVK